MVGIWRLSRSRLETDSYRECGQLQEPLAEVPCRDQIGAIPPSLRLIHALTLRFDVEDGRVHGGDWMEQCASGETELMIG